MKFADICEIITRILNTTNRRNLCDKYFALYNLGKIGRLQKKKLWLGMMWDLRILLCISNGTTYKNSKIFREFKKVSRYTTYSFQKNKRFFEPK